MQEFNVLRPDGFRVSALNADFDFVFGYGCDAGALSMIEHERSGIE